MIARLTIWTGMAALAAAFANQFEFSHAIMVWSAVVAASCAVAAILISRQPPGIATLGGRIGFGVVHWGFRAGHGRLTPAAMISWLVWMILGAALIAGIHFPDHLPIFVAWTGDLLGLLYVIGVMFANWGGRIPASLLKVVAGLIGMVVASMFLWFRTGTDHAQAIALAVAGGPPLVIGAVYGFVLVTGLMAGRSQHH